MIRIINFSDDIDENHVFKATQIYNEKTDWGHYKYFIMNKSETIVSCSISTGGSPKGTMEEIYNNFLKKMCLEEIEYFYNITLKYTL